MCIYKHRKVALVKKAQTHNDCVFLSVLVPMTTNYWDQEHRCVFKDVLMSQLYNHFVL